MKKLLISMLATVLMVTGQSSSAQGLAAVATVGAIRDALVGAIERLDTLVDNSTGNAKSLGESLTSNARSLVSEIDGRLGKKLEYTFDKLETGERRLVEDAQALVVQMNQAAQALVGRVESAAISTLGEADILAYNASYSLPCRDQNPRIVYSRPANIAANDVRELTLRGNYLAIGESPVVSVDGLTARIIARNDNEIRVEIPAKLFQGLAQEKPVSVSVAPKRRSRTNLWVTCIDSEKDGNRLSAGVRLVPTTELSFQVMMRPRAEVREEIVEDYSAREHNENCDANYAVTKEYTLSRGKLLRYDGPALSCTRCGSGISTVRQTSDRGITIDGRYSGCGYDSLNLGLTTVRNCKGHGCLNYSGKLYGEDFVATDLDAYTESLTQSGMTQRSFVFKYGTALPADARNIAWRYEVTLDKKVGARAERVVLTESNPNVGSVLSRVGNDGKLNIEIGEL